MMSRLMFSIEKKRNAYLVCTTNNAVTQDDKK